MNKEEASLWSQQDPQRLEIVFRISPISTLVSSTGEKGFSSPGERSFEFNPKAQSYPSNGQRIRRAKCQRRFVKSGIFLFLIVFLFAV